MAENMVDTKLAFPNDFDLKETPGFDDVLMIYDASTGKVKQTKMESVLSASAASIIDTATPSSSPTGTETNGQSYRVSNTTASAQVFTNFSGVSVPANSSGLLTLSGGSWVFVKDELNTAGLQEKATLDADVAAAGFLNKSTDVTNEEIFQGNNMLNPIYVKSDRIVVSAGAVGSLTGSTAIDGMPVTPGQVITVSDYLYFSNYFYSFLNASGGVVAHGLVDPSLEMTLTVPAGAATYNQEIKHPSQTHAVPDVMINTGTVALPYESYVGVITYVKNIDGKGLIADVLNENNVTPDPVSDSNAANRKYVDEEILSASANAIKKSDLGYTSLINLLDPSKEVLDSYIDSSGNTVVSTPGSGWAYNPVDVRDVADGGGVMISNITISSGHAAWYNGSTKISYAGLINSTTQPLKVTKPAGATNLRIDTMRSGIPNTEVMVNEGDTALPYQPYEPKQIESIDGVPVKGGGSGEAYDQSLNTTDNVKFNSVEMQAWSANLPEGAGVPPVDVLIGDAWIDTTDSTIKVKLS